jgi:ankyrin repeat protein
LKISQACLNQSTKRETFVHESDNQTDLNSKTIDDLLCRDLALVHDLGMLKQSVVLTLVGLCLVAGTAAAQTPASVDFARDVQPILRQSCITCHGPNQQNADLRVDRRSSVIHGRRVVPGGAANSILLHKLNGDPVYGPQMPPSGPLKPEQIATITAWIEQGAPWPDGLANEVDLPPPNPIAVAIVTAMRTGDRRPLMAASTDLLNARGPEGSTPFMYAVLYADATILKALIKKGANVNAQNDAHATALMWAAPDLDKTRVLVDAGADVNAKSADNRTPLMIAATKPGNVATVKLLLDRGANVNPTAHPGGESSPLTQAATAGDAAMMQLLVDRGADIRASAAQALSMSILNRCAKCVSLVTAADIDKGAYTQVLFETVYLADAATVAMLLDHGANINAVDPTGRTPLMYAVVSDLMRVDVVDLLITRGADVNALDKHVQADDEGWTVLDIARTHGDTPIVAALIKAGAKGTNPARPALKPVSNNTVRAAIERSLPMLQKSDINFTAKSGCFSCHNDSIAQLAVGSARKSGIRVDEALSTQAIKQNLKVLDAQRDQFHQGFFVNVEDIFAPSVLGYVAVGLDAEHYKADLTTDAIAMYLRMHQMTDGHWEYGLGDTRPPICQQYVGQTALAMRGLQLYAPAVDRAAYDDAIRRAAGWLAKVEPNTDVDRFWKLMGLAWAGTDKDAIRKSLRDVQSLQHADGGWSDMASMESNAFTTGKVLVALRAAGVSTSDAVFRRGVKFLLDTQQEDGSWHVRSRALAFQPYFDNGYPHGYDQWISAAGAGWATAALSLSGAPVTTTAR